MLTLSLLRHAKSDWSTPGMDDFDRPLAPRGLDAAPRMGAYMAHEGLKPQLVLCSAAVRTRQTLDLVLPHLATKPEISYERGLYLASAATLLKRLQQLPEDVSHAMLVGHDPGMHEIAVALAGEGERGALCALARKFPTAGLAVFRFDGARWSEIAKGKGRLLRFVTPRALD